MTEMTPSQRDRLVRTRLRVGHFLEGKLRALEPELDAALGSRDLGAFQKLQAEQDRLYACQQHWATAENPFAGELEACKAARRGGLQQGPALASSKVDGEDWDSSHSFPRPPSSPTSIEDSPTLLAAWGPSSTPLLQPVPSLAEAKTELRDKQDQLTGLRCLLAVSAADLSQASWDSLLDRMKACEADVEELQGLVLDDEARAAAEASKGMRGAFKRAWRTLVGSGVGETLQRRKEEARQ